MPQFYNITVEKHLDDPLGYDICFVDPVVYGSYASRMNHSCVPNCGVVTMVAQGRYTAAMFALKNIKKGEELTFDYCCYTDSDEEIKHCICLCSNADCRGTYISALEVRSTEHDFLNRNACIIRGCCRQKFQTPKMMSGMLKGMPR